MCTIWCGGRRGAADGRSDGPKTGRHVENPGSERPYRFPATNIGAIDETVAPKFQTDRIQLFQPSRSDIALCEFLGQQNHALSGQGALDRQQPGVVLMFSGRDRVDNAGARKPLRPQLAVIFVEKGLTEQVVRVLDLREPGGGEWKHW